MRLVVDTSVLIDHLRGNLSARQALADAVAGDARICSSVVVKVEVLAGMRPAEEHKTRQLLDALDWIAVDDDIAERAGLLANRYLRSHPGVDPVDYIIADREGRGHGPTPRRRAVDPQPEALPDVP